MTTYTTLYKLPSPELTVGSADGPAAIQALAARTERELPQLRRDDHYRGDASLLVGGNQQGVLFTTSITVAAIGWMDVDFGAIIMGSNGAVPFAGELRIRFGSTVAREIRYHNHGLAAVTATGFTSQALVTGQTSITCDILLYNDATSSQPVYGAAYNLGIRQFGAPASG